MKTAAVVDLGFNSLKLVNYRIDDGGNYESFEQYSTLAQIGDGLDETGRIKEKRIETTLDELKAFRAVVKMHGIDAVLPVATSAVREAENGSHLLARIRRETGFNFRILSERDEGALSFLGAASSLELRNCLFFDLGGGSLELVSSSRGKLGRITSLPLGSLRISQRYSKKEIGVIPAGSYSKMEKHVMSTLEDSMLDIGPGSVLVGVGGTLRAIARYRQRITEYPVNKLHNFELGRRDVGSALNTLSALSPEQLGRFEAFRGERSRTVYAGSCIIASIMDTYGFKRLTVSTHGLRDGVLIDWLHRSDGAKKAEARVSSLLDLRHETLPPTADRLARYMVGMGHLDEREARILPSAVTELIRRGETLRPESLFYAILYEDSYLSHRDQLVLALSIIYRKRPRIANWLCDEYGRMLGNKDTRSMKRLGALLELLEVVMRSEGKVVLRRRKGGIAITATGRDRRIWSEMLDGPVKRACDVLGTTITVAAEEAG